MPTINHAAREISCKIVYSGPGLGGKTTNLEYIHARLEPGSRGKLISLATEAERTLFFDFLPVEVGKVRGMQVRLHLYSVPGQTYYLSTRKLILKAVDGVVFVADSQVDRMDANLESMHDLWENLGELGVDPRHIPFVIQYNKRDLPHVAAVEELQSKLNPMGVPSFQAVGTRGVGVFDTLTAVSKLVVRALG